MACVRSALCSFRKPPCPDLVSAESCAACAPSSRTRDKKRGAAIGLPEIRWKQSRGRRTVCCRLCRRELHPDRAAETAYQSDLCPTAPLREGSAPSQG